MNSSNGEERRGAKMLLYLGLLHTEMEPAPQQEGARGTNRTRHPELSSTLGTHAMIRGTRSTSPTNSALARTTRPHQRICSTRPSLLTDTDRAHSSAPAGPCSIQHTGTRLNTHTPWPQRNCRPRPSWQHMQHILAHDAHSTHTLMSSLVPTK